MNSIYLINEDIKMKKELDKLMEDWKEHVCNNSESKLAKQKGVGNLADLFVSDGFFPYYNKMKYRILFIGHESWGEKGINKDMIYELYSDIKKRLQVGDTPINEAYFHSLMFYVAFGILNNFPSYNQIDKASDMVNDFAVEHGFSYALMNISKLINKKENKKVDDYLVNKFINISQKSSRNFFEEEITILNPDIIVGMFNAQNYNNYNKCLGKFNQNKECQSLYKTGTLEIKCKKYNYIETYIFSNNLHWRLEDIFYNPIIEICKKIFEKNQK